MDKHVELEVCVDSAQSAQAAQRSGATRVELCDNLLVGGTTPSIGMINLVREQLSIPIHVLIRPRSGDFSYTDSEMEVMRRDIVHSKAAGVDGIVLGLLRPDGSVDTERTQELLELARPLQFTFHRAFDMASDPHNSLEDIIRLGFDYLLTSGQQPAAYEGSELIARLVNQAGDRISIMPGGGVTAENARALVESTGVRHIHASCRSQVPSQMKYRRPGLSLGAWPEAEYTNSFADPLRIAELVKALSF